MIQNHEDITASSKQLEGTVCVCDKYTRYKDSTAHSKGKGKIIPVL